MIKHCPSCGGANLPSTLSCSCGYNFEKGKRKNRLSIAVKVCWISGLMLMVTVFVALTNPGSVMGDYNAYRLTTFGLFVVLFNLILVLVFWGALESRVVPPMAPQRSHRQIARYRELVKKGLSLEGASRKLAKEEVRWAEQGDAEAQGNLGMMCATGGGVAKDYVQAYLWLDLAASRGLERATQYRDWITQKMTAEQIAEAQRLAREWKPKTGGE